MSLYVDTSALLKRYIEEDESVACERLLVADPSWVTARHTWVEVLRNLARLLRGPDRARMRQTFRADWARMLVVELDATTCERAGDLGKAGSVRLGLAGGREREHRRLLQLSGPGRRPGPP